MAEPAIAAAWFDDPHGGDQLRWWDGSQWTDHVAPRPVPAPAPTPALAVVPEPAPVPVPVPVPAAVPAADPDPAAAVVAATPTRVTTGSRSTPKVLAIAGGAVLLVIVLLAVVIPTLLADDPAAKVGQAAPVTPGAPAAATGPALTPQEYATQMRALSAETDAMDDDELGDNPTPEQVRAAIAPLEAVVAKMQAISPPAQVATEHATLVTQYQTMITVFEKLAVNPKDEAAFGQVFAGVLMLVGTIEGIEKKLNLDIDGEAPVSSAAATA